MYFPKITLVSNDHLSVIILDPNQYSSHQAQISKLSECATQTELKAFVMYNMIMNSITKTRESIYYIHHSQCTHYIHQRIYLFTVYPVVTQAIVQGFRPKPIPILNKILNM